MFSSPSSSSQTAPTCPLLTSIFRPLDPCPAFPRSLGPKIHAVSILSHWPSEHFMSSSLLFLNPGMKSEDQSVLEPDAWDFVSGFCHFSSACFVKCKVRPSLCLRFRRPALAAFLQGALLTVSCISQSLS